MDLAVVVLNQLVYEAVVFVQHLKRNNDRPDKTRGACKDQALLPLTASCDSLLNKPTCIHVYETYMYTCIHVILFNDDDVSELLEAWILALPKMFGVWSMQYVLLEQLFEYQY